MKLLIQIKFKFYFVLTSSGFSLAGDNITCFDGLVSDLFFLWYVVRVGVFPISLALWSSLRLLRNETVAGLRPLPLWMKTFPFINLKTDSSIIGMCVYVIFLFSVLVKIKLLAETKFFFVMKDFQT